MKVKENDNKKAFCIAAIASLIAGVGLLIIYIIKGIYPFGSRNISYYDMAQGFVPLYYRTYDILHGTKDLFWEWQSGLGSYNVDTVGSYVFSPFCLFFLFVKRSQILESMSLYLLLKVCICSGVMTYLLRKKWRNISDLWYVIFGVLYAGCGYVIQYYTVIHFLDMVILFPILMYFTDELLEKKKVAGFTILTTIGLILNVYIMYQIMIFVLFYSMVKILVDCKEEIKGRIATLGISVVISLLMASFIVVPYIVTLLQSSRLEVAKIINEEHEVWKLVDTYYGNKVMMLYGCELPIAILLICIIFRKKTIKKLAPWIGLLGILFLPIWFEFVNEAWHPGGYVGFPMRFGFILSYMFVYVACKILSSGYLKLECDILQKNNLLHYLRLFSIPFIFFVIFAIYIFTKGYNEYGIRDSNAYAPYISIVVMLVILFGVSIISFRTKTLTIICFSVFICQYILGWNGFLAPNNMFSVECEDTIVKSGELVHCLIEEYDNKDIERIKDCTNSLNANYPFVINHASISGWTCGAKDTTQNTLQKLGYSIHYTRLLDNGGTIFSDSLFAINRIITFNNESNYAYNIQKNDGTYYIAEAKKVYPFGIVLNNSNITKKLDEDTTPLNIQNELFRIISNKDVDLIKQYNVNDVIENADESNPDYYIYDCKIPIEGKGILYIESNDEDLHFVINIGGKTLIMPDIENPQNTEYPGIFLNGLVECGFFENEIVDCTVITSDLVDSKLTFGILDYDLLTTDIDSKNEIYQNIKINKRGMTIDIESSGEEYLFLPIQYDSDYIIENNEKVVQGIPGLDESFLIIRLEEGINNIKIKFIPSGFREGLILSIIGILVFFIWINMGSKFVYQNKIIGYISYWIYMICVIMFCIYLYILPFIKNIYAISKYKIW